MDDNSEAIQRSFLKLLQDLDVTASPDDVEQLVSRLDFGSEYEADLALNRLDLLDEEVDFSPDELAFQNLSFSGEEPLRPGEVPAVQDRFYALLKRRLQVEIQRNLPLFPWETEVTDYETETAGLVYATSAATQPVAASVPVSTSASRSKVPVWIAQLQNLNLPVAMPDDVLAHLLERCQEAVQTSLREGAKLVQAVESLFPGHSQNLNQLAGMVLVSPARSGNLTQTRLPSQASNFPSSYEAAVPAQQMVLSLLAAKEIIDSLTLTMSPNQPSAERQWVTEAGLLTLQTEYKMQQNISLLHVQGELPCGGSLTLRAGEGQSITQRTDAGRLSLELFDLQPSQTYPLEVRLNTPDQSTLTFAVHPSRD